MKPDEKSKCQYDDDGFCDVHKRVIRMKECESCKYFVPLSRPLNDFLIFLTHLLFVVFVFVAELLKKESGILILAGFVNTV